MAANDFSPHLWSLSVVIALLTFFYDGIGRNILL